MVAPLLAALLPSLISAGASVGSNLMKEREQDPQMELLQRLMGSQATPQAQFNTNFAPQKIGVR